MAVLIDPQIIAFTGIAAILTIAPGSDTLLVMRSVLSRGQRAGLLATLGISSGLFFHASLSALGLSVILVRSAAAYNAVKLLGACYLIFLGCQSLWGAFRRRVEQPTESETTAKPLERRDVKKSFAEGLLNNLLNPKVAIFYLAFLPQFISPSDSVFAKSMLLGSIHFLQGVVWLTLVTLLMGRIRVALTRPRVKQTLDAITGFVFIGFGLRLAAEKR
jgi:RhtB (resistance to homoserine/threonine) family protein